MLMLDGGDLADASTVSIASGATLAVVGGTPTLGIITGQGILTVTGSGTSLTAGSITANSLTIGGSAPTAGARTLYIRSARSWRDALDFTFSVQAIAGISRNNSTRRHGEKDE